MKLVLCASIAVFFLACRQGSSFAERKGSGEIREPAVSGQFYPGEARMLRQAIEQFLADSAPPKVADPVALVAPHAGYVFSGQIAADAWRQLQGREIDLVVLLGTNHTTAGFGKIALHPGAGFRTPLGVAPCDREAAEALAAADPDCVFDAAVHAREHSVEVQVPFAQHLFPKAKILPAVVGSSDPAVVERFGAALAKVLQGRKAIVVASSDLSHYPSAKDARAVDRKVLAAMAGFDPADLRAVIDRESSRGIRGLGTCACGEAPVLAAMAAAKAFGATRGVVVSYANSGDVPIGDSDRVVGYGAVVFARDGGGTDTEALREPDIPPDGALDEGTKRALLAFARETIRRYQENGTVPLARSLPSPALRPQGAFVTLTRKGELRGCIGRMIPDGPLGRTVGAMALQAAFEDPRFPPLSQGELPQLQIEISALTPMKPVAGAQDIVVGRDGVLLSKGGRSAVFLPQVATEQGWTRDEMLDHLSRKAGLPAGSWREGASFSVFQAEVFGEGK
jgi:AmmeMemoRadiSam system protein B/AmmeMemoRadiSam system protein A